LELFTVERANLNYVRDRSQGGLAATTIIAKHVIRSVRRDDDPEPLAAAAFGKFFDIRGNGRSRPQSVDCQHERWLAGGLRHTPKPGSDIVRR